jgi:hypothetical protein
MACKSYLPSSNHSVNYERVHTEKKFTL